MPNLQPLDKKSPTQVLQMNVRLSEGGAAGVARTLSDELRAQGIRSPFAYGYAKHGLSSPLEASYEGVRMTPALVAATNRANYALFGAETLLRSPRMWRELRASVRSSDVVHLHAIHSYFVSTSQLFDLLIEENKPVVWTLHDQWAMTGRCAQPGTCRRWESGCKVCPNLAAYPPAKYDHAAARWTERSSEIRELQEKVPTAIVSCADWLAEEAEIAGLKNVSVIHNSVDREFWDALHLYGKRSHAPAGSTLFMSRDLRDSLKVDRNVLSRVAAMPGRELTVVGDHAEPIIAGAKHQPAITSRAELAAMMLGHRDLIFTSKVDYFPLTITEALTAGMTVFAVDSRAAREFENNPLVRIYPDTSSLIRALGSRVNENGAGAGETLDENYNPTRMTTDYLELYSRLLEASR